jgi:hypothetical protein
MKGGGEGNGMPQIRCSYIDCMYLEDGYCTSSGINLDPDDGCLTYTSIDDIPIDEDDWEDEEIEGVWDDTEDGDLYIDDDEEDWDDEDF